MRAGLSFVLLFALVLAGGCADDEAPPLTLSVRTFSFDGPPPGGLKAVRVDRDGSEEMFDLVPAPARGLGAYTIVGGRDGSYRVEAPGDWWMLQSRVTLPEVFRDRTPPDARLGHAHCVYIGAATGTIRPGRVWGAERIAPGGARETIATTVEADEEGYVVALRIDPAAWRDEIEVIGHLEIGAPGAVDPEGPLGPLAEAIRFRPATTGRPVVAQVRQAPLSPVSVVLVPAAAGVEVDGREVRVRIRDLPIEVVYRARVKDAVAHVPAVSVVGRDLAIEVPGVARPFLLDQQQWKRQANVRILLTEGEPSRRIEAGLPEGASCDLVQARPAGAPAFGRVPFTVEGGVVFFELPTSEVDVLFRDGTRYATLHVGASEGGGKFDVPVFVEGVKVEGRVDPPTPGTVVRCFRVLGEEAVLGDGFALGISPTGNYEGLLPTGTWHLEVASPLGEWRREAPLVADAPGAVIHLPLRGP